MLQVDKNTRHLGHNSKSHATKRAWNVIEQDRQDRLLRAGRTDRTGCLEGEGETGQVVESGKDRQDMLLRVGRTDRTGG